MPTLQPDDDIKRARLVYLGPPGWTLPILLPYAQWFAGLLFTAGYAALLCWLFSGPGPFIFAVALAVPSTSALFKLVNPDRPVRKVARTVVTDWRRIAPQPQDGSPLLRLSGSHITVNTSKDTTPRGERHR